MEVGFNAGRAGPGRPSTIRSVNLVVRFLCELGLLVALAVWGFHAGAGVAAKVAFGLGTPLLAAGFAIVVAVNITLDRVLA